MSQDKYSFFGTDFPAIDWASVTTSDATDLDRIPRAIYVGGAGDVAAVSEQGSVVTFAGVGAGSILPIQPIRINATNTSATDIIALY